MVAPAFWNLRPGDMHFVLLLRLLENLQACPVVTPFCVLNNDVEGLYFWYCFIVLQGVCVMGCVSVIVLFFFFLFLPYLL